VSEPVLDFSFPHRWQARLLAARPLILPARHYVYPRHAEEVERGALELLITPAAESATEFAPKDWPCAQHFLATCALGFRDPLVPTGIWSCPNPEEICAVAGGYAYVIDTTAPQRFIMLPYRPVLGVLPLPADGLLLFVGHHSILAWGARGQAWESEKLSDEGVTIAGVRGCTLHGVGWHMLTDKEIPFALDLKKGCRISVQRP
jgi:hypothetical protein